MRTSINVSGSRLEASIESAVMLASKSRTGVSLVDQVEHIAQVHPGDRTSGSAQDLIVHCQGGTRSAIAASLLERNGRTVSNMTGGFGEWERAGFPVEKS